MHSLVSVPEEQRLHREEARLRTIAAQARGDEIALAHLAAIEMAEDLEQIHANAESGYAAQGVKHRVDLHSGHKLSARQLKLWHLLQLDRHFSIIPSNH